MWCGRTDGKLSGCDRAGHWPAVVDSTVVRSSELLLYIVRQASQSRQQHLPMCVFFFFFNCCQPPALCGAQANVESSLS
jgi:hypothetical protein